MDQVLSGLDFLLSQNLSPIRGMKIGLITNSSAVTRDLVTASDALQSAGADIKAFFAPEHGASASIADGVAVPSGVNARGIPIHSLYGETKKPTPEMLEGIDGLVFDIQDVGARFYTYLYTMAYAMQACAEHDKQFFVLDRPNPIGGTIVQGPVLDPDFASFVGLYPMPIRYGMTIGELAVLFNCEFGIEVDLQIIPLQGWQRTMYFDQTGLPWVPPSPNMPSPGTAIVYPGTCLIEGTNVSEGRGTLEPFTTIGAPWIDAFELSKALRETSSQGAVFHPTDFSPVSSKYEGEKCGGVRIEVTDREEFDPVLTGIKVLETIHRLYPDKFAFLEPKPGGKKHFDLLVGTDSVRLGIESGLRAEEIAQSWQEDLIRFEWIRSNYLIY